MLVIEIDGRKYELTGDQQRGVEAASLRAMRTPAGLVSVYVEIGAIVNERSESMTWTVDRLKKVRAEMFDLAFKERAQSLGRGLHPNEALSLVSEVERLTAEIARLKGREEAVTRAGRELHEREQACADALDPEVVRAAFRVWLGGDPYRLVFDDGGESAGDGQGASTLDVGRACKSFDVALTLVEHGEIGSE